MTGPVRLYPVAIEALQFEIVEDFRYSERLLLAEAEDTLRAVRGITSDEMLDRLDRLRRRAELLHQLGGFADSPTSDVPAGVITVEDSPTLREVFAEARRQAVDALERDEANEEHLVDLSYDRMNLHALEMVRAQLDDAEVVA